MKLSIINCVNGNFSVVAEGITTDQAARVAFHDRCKVLWNAPDVLTAEIAIMDENLDCVEGYREFIHHDPQPEPQPEPESE